MPQARSGTSASTPSPRRRLSAAGKPPGMTCCTPSGALRRSRISPCASSRYARAEVVPQSIAISAAAMPTVALPPCRFFFVARARLDPALAILRLLFLPEWRAGLEIVHDELAGGKGLAAVRAGHDDEHDLLGGLELADAVDDEHVVHAPACPGLVDDVVERLLGHARIVFQRERVHRGGVVDVAHETDERGDRADARVAAAQCRDLARDVEILGLNAHRHDVNPSRRLPEERARLRRLP